MKTYPLTAKSVAVVLFFVVSIAAVFLLRDESSGVTGKHVVRAAGGAVVILAVSFAIDAFYPKKKIARLALWIAALVGVVVWAASAPQ